MSEDEIVERVARAMTRYVEGSESGSGGTWWNIHDSFDEGRKIAWFRDRDERDMQLSWKNACAAIDAHKAALADEMYIILPAEPTVEMVEAALRSSDKSPRGLWRAMRDVAPAEDDTEPPSPQDQR